MDKLTLAEQVIAWASGTGVLGILLGGWINKKKDDIEVSLKEQVFYKTLISDIEERRVVERESYENKLSKMSSQITGLKSKIEKFLDKLKENETKIKDQEVNLSKWESYCEKLKVIIEHDKLRFTELDQSHEKLENQLKELKSKK